MKNPGGEPRPFIYERHKYASLHIQLTLALNPGRSAFSTFFMPGWLFRVVAASCYDTQEGDKLWNE